jgi:hypothetical protein
VPSEDLRSIPSLQENHRRGLVKKLGITSVQALADADPDTICTELQNLRPPPSRGQVLQWQREARNRLSDADIDRPAWHTAASFAVIFAQRQVDGVWERRVQAQQTEVEPEPAGQEWQSWDCEPLCDWMHGQLPADHAESEAGAVGETGVTPAVEPAASAEPSRTPRGELRIVSATIIDAAHELELIAVGGGLAETPPEDLTPPVHLNITVSGARSGQQVRAAAWFVRQAGPGWSPQEPVVLSSSGQAELDLSSVPSGEHKIRLLAWATDARATLAAVTLPVLTFRQDAS